MADKPVVILKLWYSNDWGGTWSSAQEFTVHMYSCIKAAIEVRKHEFEYNRRIRKYYEQRVRIRFAVDVDEIAESKDSGSAKYLFLQAFNAAQLRRIQVIDPATSSGMSVSGLSYFTADDNTNWLVHEGGPFEFPDEIREQRKAVFNLIGWEKL